jgi:hypothetical protein
LCYYARIRHEVTQNLAIRPHSALEGKKTQYEPHAGDIFCFVNKKLMRSRYFAANSGIYILTEGERLRELFNDSDAFGVSSSPFTVGGCGYERGLTSPVRTLFDLNGTYLSGTRQVIASSDAQALHQFNFTWSWY